MNPLLIPLLLYINHKKLTQQIYIKKESCKFFVSLVFLPLKEINIICCPLEIVQMFVAVVKNCILYEV